MSPSEVYHENNKVIGKLEEVKKKIREKIEEDVSFQKSGSHTWVIGKKNEDGSYSYGGASTYMFINRAEPEELKEAGFSEELEKAKKYTENPPNVWTWDYSTMEI